MWREVRRFSLAEGIKSGCGERIRLEGTEIIQEEWIPDRLDVTEQFTAELVKSRSTSGYYVALKLKGCTKFVLGVDQGHIVRSTHSELHSGKHLSLERAPRARVSFNIKVED